MNNGWANFPKFLLILAALFVAGIMSYPTIMSLERSRLEDLSLFKQLFEGELTCSALDQGKQEIEPRYSRLMMRVQTNCDLEYVNDYQSGQDTLRNGLLRWQEGFSAFNANDLEGSVSAWSKSPLVVYQLNDKLISEGNVLENSGFKEDAEKYYRAIALLDPQAWRYEYLGDYYLRTNRQTQAIAAFRQGQLISGLADWYYLEGRVNEIKEEWQKGANNYLISIQYGGENGNTLFRLAQLFGLRLKDETNSIIFCQQAINIAPSHYACYEFLGDIYQSREEIGLAIKMYEAGIQNVVGPHAAGYKSMFYSKIGEVHFTHGEDDKAESRYTDAVNISPYNGDAQRGLARLRIKQGDVQNALKLMELAILGNRVKGHSIPVEWYLEQGSYYELAGEYQNAISAYQESLILDPDNHQALARMEILGNAGK